MKHRIEYPPKEIIQELFTYDPEIGNLIRRTSVGSVKEGSISGVNNGRGYLRTKIDGIDYLVHILIYMIGKPPKLQIDHDDGDTLNNKWNNLIHMTQSDNIRKARLNSNNTSGIRGVSFSEERKRWTVRIRVGKVYKWMGSYKTLEEAGNSRKVAEEKYWGTKNVF